MRRRAGALLATGVACLALASLFLIADGPNSMKIFGQQLGRSGSRGAFWGCFALFAFLGVGALASALRVYTMAGFAFVVDAAGVHFPVLDAFIPHVHHVGWDQLVKVGIARRRDGKAGNLLLVDDGTRQHHLGPHLLPSGASWDPSSLAVAEIAVKLAEARGMASANELESEPDRSV